MATIGIEQDAQAVTRFHREQLLARRGAAAPAEASAGLAKLDADMMARLRDERATALEAQRARHLAAIELQFGCACAV